MRVERTFAFVDLCGFTAYIDDFGDQRAVAILSRLRALLQGGAERDGIQVVSWLGDGAMLVGQQADALVGLVLHVRDTIASESPLPLRGGIAVGSAIMFDGHDYVGAAVNLAARLAARARPNQVLATEDVTTRISHPVALRPVKRMIVSGFERPIEVRELVGACRLSAAPF